jgi:hypothetical protein
VPVTVNIGGKQIPRPVAFIANYRRLESAVSITQQKDDLI